MQVAAGKIGQSPAPPGTPFEMQVNAVGRLSDPAQFSDIVVRADPAAGSVVRLRDVARIELGALQYSSSGFFGKDRRGQLHRVPLMTVSIGVVTNERRHFTHAAQVSALATEMKSYAKTLPGSVYSIDRRTDSRPIDGPVIAASFGSAAAREEE